LAIKKQNAENWVAKAIIPVNNFEAGGGQMDPAKANCAVPSVSGAFLATAECGLLHPLSSEVLRFAQLTRKKNKLMNGRRHFNDPVWMARLAQRTSPRKFNRLVKQEVIQLEHELAVVFADWESIRLRLQEDHPEIVAEIESSETLSGSIGSRPRREIRPSKDPAIQKRNQLIRKFRGEAHVNICYELDDASIPIPSSWAKNFGVKNFIAAYAHAKCRRLVHRILSGAKNTTVT
jgi:hypothetical protein